MRFVFPKNQKLKKNKDITELFVSGKSLFYDPVRINYRIIPENSENPVLAGFSVSKHNFKNAVDRNLIKRRMRECYRLNKSDIINSLSNKNLKIHLMFIYSSNKITNYQNIDKSIKTLLNRLLNILI